MSSCQIGSINMIMRSAYFRGHQSQHDMDSTNPVGGWCLVPGGVVVVCFVCWGENCQIWGVGEMLPSINMAYYMACIYIYKVSNESMWIWKCYSTVLLLLNNILFSNGFDLGSSKSSYIYISCSVKSSTSIISIMFCDNWVNQNQSSMTQNARWFHCSMNK